MSRALVFGSLNIDHTYQMEHIVTKGETQTAKKLTTQAGGKGLNQAIALSKAGVEVYMAGAVGIDGIFLEEALEKNFVNTNLVYEMGEGATGHAIIQTDALGENSILLYPGTNREITSQMIEKSFRFFGEEDFLFLQNEINLLPEIVKAAKEKGMKVVLNPSPMDEAIAVIPMDLVDYLVINEIEATQILAMKEVFPDANQEQAVVEALRDTFPNHKIVLTLGKRGSLYIEKNIILKQKAYPVKAVDTTAAGDTFLGYFFAMLMKGKTVEQALYYGAKASAISVTEVGAADSIPFLEDVEQVQF